MKFLKKNLIICLFAYFPDLTPEAAKRRLNQTRPQSAFIPRSRPSSQSGSSAQVLEQGGQVGGLPTSPRSSSSDPRRRSDFVSRYESLLNRCQAATKAVDELDLLRLQKAAANANQTGTGSSQDLAHHDLAQDHVVAIEDDNDEEEIADVDFDEEEVLQKVHEFQKDYQERKSQKQQPSSSAVTVSKNLRKSNFGPRARLVVIRMANSRIFFFILLHLCIIGGEGESLEWQIQGTFFKSFSIFA